MKRSERTEHSYRAPFKRKHFNYTLFFFQVSPEELRDVVIQA